MLPTRNSEYYLGNIDVEQQCLIQEFHTNLTTPTSSGGLGVNTPPTIIESPQAIPASWIDNLNTQPKQPVTPVNEMCLQILHPDITEKF